ncbi:E3 ubiquitin-protein ligase RNF138 [Dendropsophus ebraccatus]|uniref:E3 ubiquitin-protein ligase RNF138 n=1 Tax=Dendropsophus ebraccatus TaxID=150705 RepID=UPI003831FB3B
MPSSTQVQADENLARLSSCIVPSIDCDMAEASAITAVFSETYEPEDFSCSICQDIFQTPVRTHNCQHVFCRKCLLMAIKASGAHCPLCRGALHRWERSAPTRASDIEMKMRILSLGCTYCGKPVKLSSMRLHYKTCRSYQEEFGIAPKDSKVQSNPYTTKPLETSYKCPLCHQGNLNRKALLDHCNFMHYFEVAEAVCPICSALPGGDACHATGNIVGHLNARHQFNYEEYMNVYLDEEAQFQAAIEKSYQFFY